MARWRCLCRCLDKTDLDMAKESILGQGDKYVGQWQNDERQGQGDVCIC